MTDWKAARSQPVPGLTIETCKCGGYTYARLMHAQSGKQLWKWGSRPIKGVRDFAAQVAQHLAPFDWTVSADQLAPQEPAIKAAVFSIDVYTE